MLSTVRGVVAGLTLCLSGGFVSPAAGQVPGPTNARPDLAPDAATAMKFLGQWSRVTSGQNYFQGAIYVGSAACQGCHDQQIDEWRKTWHSKILTAPSSDAVKGDFNNASIVFENVRAVAPGKDGDLSKLQNVPVTFEVRTESANGKYYFVVVDPSDTHTPKNGERYEVALVVGGKWQQTYHVRPTDAAGQGGDFYFPAPIRWSVNPVQAAGQPTGWWEVINFQPESWVWTDPSGLAIPRKPTELPVMRFAEPRCMGCHTTGFQFSVPKPPAVSHWAMSGNGEMAVGCERCHGPGSKHIAAAREKEAAGSKLDPNKDYMWTIHGLKDLSLDQQNQVCGECHARVGGLGKSQARLAFPNVLDETDPTETKPKPFLPGDANLTERAQFWSYVVPLTTVPGTSPGDPPGTTLNQGFDNFWPDGRGKKSRTQWQDHTRSAHATKAGASCMTCHAFHGEAVSKDPQQQAKLRQPVKELCESCHNRTGATWQPNKEMFAGTAAVAPSQHALAEVQCVDCHMGAVGQRMTKTTKKNEPAFDVSFHGTSMTLASHDTMVPVGSPDMRGNCEVCHTDERPMANGTIPPPKTTLELIEYVRKIQDYTKSQIREVQTRSKSNKSVSSATVLQLSNAQANLNMILIDGSLGVHNSRITPAGVVSLQGAGAICLRNARNWIELACRQPGANCQPFSEPINGPLPAPSPPLCLQ